MKNLTITALITLTMMACSTPKFGQVNPNTKYSKKFSKWLVVEKYEVDDTSCIYYWNRGTSTFIDRCSLYDVGDTIKHH